MKSGELNNSMPVTSQGRLAKIKKMNSEALSHLESWEFKKPPWQRAKRTPHSRALKRKKYILSCHFSRSPIKNPRLTGQSEKFQLASQGAGKVTATLGGHAPFWRGSGAESARGSAQDSSGRTCLAL